MTKAEQFEALALRCEQATRPDRELDAAIYVAVFDIDPKYAAYIHHYTDSVDAALTLVPEGYVVNLGNDEPIWAQVWIDNDPTSRGGGATMALALCAAALRARAQMERGK